MRSYSLYFRDGPWGGCNQFLKALRKSFLSSRNYSHSIYSADIVLFDSFNNLFSVLYFKFRFTKYFFHRIDGPISTYRGKDLFVDKTVHPSLVIFPDGVIFQSIIALSKTFVLQST